ncbi:hypothetical protein [Streptococcus pyogenes]|uniref:hypothetical protein n=1 Tax=Streptococcus pyogenes TaxID=1314 RepID=UPI0004F89B71|nr:hypothetical protein [Streptococcus pyogenes]AIQ02292.1 hypothetical protein FE90_1535 [Streptococcus pyogenes]SQF50825.1 hypothetical membrane associated protein [Streptococcus pyogenes]HEP1340557.1 hypothetical protein [Streptococcus pyogenes]HEQ3167309.1 hypothetical protein [Streptococcus pyogenes]HER0759594.1 hypothetical protein [Streptococcus pyogenes]
MKTKSKRFLNLATLCLALLGTTLLMAHPVKADGDLVAEVYQKGRDDGEKAGYDEGKKENSPRVPKIDNPRPSSTPYDQNPTLKAEYGNGYSDAYLSGYNKGWGETHPIEATLQFLWDTIYYWFGSLFSNY